MRIMVVLLMMVLFFISCRKEIRTTPNKEEKKVIDSLYAKKVGRIKQEVDEKCDSIRKAVYNEAVDSILKDYLREINDILHDGSESPKTK